MKYFKFLLTLCFVINPSLLFGMKNNNESVLLPKQLISRFSIVNKAKKSNYDAVETLLKNKIDPNSTKAEGETALHMAAWNCNISIAQLLLKYGADVNKKDGREVTPLYIATLGGNLEIIKLFLVNGAYVNIKCNTNDYCLHKAVTKKNLDCVKLFLTPLLVVAELAGFGDYTFLLQLPQMKTFHEKIKTFLLYLMRQKTVFKIPKLLLNMIIIQCMDPVLLQQTHELLWAKNDYQQTSFECAYLVEQNNEVIDFDDRPGKITELLGTLMKRFPEDYFSSHNKIKETTF